MKTKKDVELMFEAASNAEPVKASMLIELPVEHPIPELPTVDGEYKLVIVEGVASWVLIA